MTGRAPGGARATWSKCRCWELHRSPMAGSPPTLTPARTREAGGPPRTCSARALQARHVESTAAQERQTSSPCRWSACAIRAEKQQPRRSECSDCQPPAA